MMDRERGNAVSDDMIQIQARIKEVLYLRKPASRPDNQSVSRPAVSQSASRPVGQPAVSQTVSQSVRRAISQSDRWAFNHPAGQSIKQSINQSINQPVSERSGTSIR